MQVWGIGYGAMPKFVKDYTKIYTQQDGVNQVTYGNLLPSNKWQISSDAIKQLRISSSSIVCFENPIAQDFSVIKYTSVKTFYTGKHIYIGSTPLNNDILDITLVNDNEEHIISLQNVDTPFYLSFRNTSDQLVSFITNMTLE